MFLTKRSNKNNFYAKQFLLGSRIKIDIKDLNDPTAQWSLSKQRTKMIKINNQVASNILEKLLNFQTKF